MPTTSEVVHFGPATIVQGETELEVTCRVTVTQQVIESRSGDVRRARPRWSGQFTCTSGRIDVAAGLPTFLRLPDGEHEIALKDVRTDSAGATVGEFYGRGSPPGE